MSLFFFVFHVIFVIPYSEPVYSPLPLKINQILNVTSFGTKLALWFMLFPLMNIPAVYNAFLFYLNSGEAKVVIPPVTGQTLKGTSDTLTAMWSKPSDDVTGYLVVLTPVDKDPQDVKIDNPDETTATFKDLVPGLECTVDIIPLAGETQGEKVTIKGKTGM